LGEIADIEFGLNFAVLGVEGDESFVFETAEFAIGEDKEVAAAAGGVEEAQAAEFLLEGEKAIGASGGTVGENFCKLGMEFVEKKRVEEFHDVALRSVMGADLTAGFVVEDALEEGAENGGGNTSPLEVSAGNKGVAEFGVERAGDKVLGKEAAVHVRELGKVFVEGALTLVFRQVEHIPKLAKFATEVGSVAIGGFNKSLERARLKNASVLGKKAEEDADKIAFEGMASIASGAEFVVERGQEFGGLDVGGVFGVEPDGFLAFDKGKFADVAVEFGEGKFGDPVRFARVEEREITLVFGF